MQYATIGGSQGICPAGWHIPTLAEFQTLSAVVNSDGNSLKEIGEGTGGGVGTNESGFSALLTGFRGTPGGFGHLDYDASIWSSSEGGTNVTYRLYLYYGDSVISLGIDEKGYGFSVRCIKD